MEIIRGTIKIRTRPNEEPKTESFDSFELFGEKFHITKSQDNKFLYTVTHEDTGFCFSDAESDVIEITKKNGIEYLKAKGKRKVKRAIRRSKRFIKSELLLQDKKPDRLFWWVSFIFGMLGLSACYAIVFHPSFANHLLLAHIYGISLIIFTIWFLYIWIKNYNTPEKLKK
ncbi:hypothetical protein KAR91_25645 [Candidatus Pacearchaeota archaeon]|nr:hypothetical protein [Candidatus Pacearchaeota archaeon]